MNETATDFLNRHGFKNASLSELGETGASLRKYQRVTAADGRTAIITYVADAAMEITRFSEVAQLLRGMNLSAPEIYGADEANKLLLQEDFGDASFSRLIKQGGDEQALHLLATDVLITIQKSFGADDEQKWAAKLLRYDFRLWQAGLSNFFIHYLPCVGAKPLSSAEQGEFLGLWQKLLAPFEALPNTLLMRDFKPANMMMLEKREGARKVGLIDFQDAGLGSPLYDLVELTQSWRRELPPALSAAVLKAYGKARPEFSEDAIMSGCMAFGGVRWIQWLSSCAKYAREGRPQFLANIPGIWRAADRCLADPALSELHRWFAQYAPVQLRAPEEVAA